MAIDERKLLQFLRRLIKETEEELDELGDETAQDAYLAERSYGAIEALQAVIEFVRGSRARRS
jgi:hypothetical protein